jgi:hypothetical protein
MKAVMTKDYESFAYYESDFGPLISQGIAKNSLPSLSSNRSAVVDIRVLMKSTPCAGALTPRETLRLETEQEMRLHTCALCGKRNLYAVKDGLGRWALEVHNKPLPRKTSAHSARKTKAC